MVEGMFHQYAEKVSYGDGPFGKNFQEEQLDLGGCNCQTGSRTTVVRRWNPAAFLFWYYTW
jgi:hypothetical protein